MTVTNNNDNDKAKDEARKKAGREYTAKSRLKTKVAAEKRATDRLRRKVYDARYRAKVRAEIQASVAMSAPTPPPPPIETPSLAPKILFGASPVAAPTEFLSPHNHKAFELITDAREQREARNWRSQDTLQKNHEAFVDNTREDTVKNNEGDMEFLNMQLKVLDREYQLQLLDENEQEGAAQKRPIASLLLSAVNVNEEMADATTTAPATQNANASFSFDFGSSHKSTRNEDHELLPFIMPTTTEKFDFSSAPSSTPKYKQEGAAQKRPIASLPLSAVNVNEEMADATTTAPATQNASFPFGFGSSHTPTRNEGHERCPFFTPTTTGKFDFSSAPSSTPSL
jgi:hypothetical protein